MKHLNISVMSNIILGVIFGIFCILCSFDSSKHESLETVNSEYNGTIYAGDKESNKVSLMINVYWGTEELEKILEILSRHNIKTTFFVGGTWVKENPILLKQIFDAGHEIASHGYSHKEHGKLAYEANYEEIEKCHKIVKEVLGIDMKLFAPPGGSYNKNTVSAANKLGYKTIMWTKDTIDWRDKNSSLIYTRAVTNMCGGDLILMHPTEATVEALTNIISYAVGHGFEPVTVSETLGLA